MLRPGLGVLSDGTAAIILGIYRTMKQKSGSDNWIVWQARLYWRDNGERSAMLKMNTQTKARAASGAHSTLNKMWIRKALVNRQRWVRRWCYFGMCWVELTNSYIRSYGESYQVNCAIYTICFTKEAAWMKAATEKYQDTGLFTQRKHALIA